MLLALIFWLNDQYEYRKQEKLNKFHLKQNNLIMQE